MTHTIKVEMWEKVPEAVLGLPKNWKIIFKDFDEEHEDNRLAKYDKEEEKYYVEYSIRSYSGESIAPLLFKYEVEKLRELLEMQVKTWGRNQYRGVLKKIEDCLSGY
ncbi:hypothetical protein LCGC14_1009340 [marine sediment metagenome]|uniref:Uncharacterized protein n=1 Tax=marine sediment metagenome TaxID=412755 RepID=A0A0F9N0S1_9ZZZZ